MENGCATEFCDFAFTGSNTNSGSSTVGGSGQATTSFTLKLRLEYPKDVQPGPTPIGAPDTMITTAPKKRIRTKSGKAKVAIRFKSTSSGASFRCRLDKAAFSPCTSPFKRKVGPGKHRFAVVSVHQGKTDPSPAVRKWTVRKAKKKLRS